MKYMDFFKEIKKGISGNLYLLYGPEEYTKEEDILLFLILLTKVWFFSIL